MAENTLPSVSDFLPEIICLGIDCAVCGILYSAYYFTNRAVSSIASAAKFDLDNQVLDWYCNGACMKKIYFGK